MHTIVVLLLNLHGLVEVSKRSNWELVVTQSQWLVWLLLTLPLYERLYKFFTIQMSIYNKMINWSVTFNLECINNFLWFTGMSHPLTRVSWRLCISGVLSYSWWDVWVPWPSLPRTCTTPVANLCQWSSRVLAQLSARRLRDYSSTYVAERSSLSRD